MLSSLVANMWSDSQRDKYNPFIGTQLGTMSGMAGLNLDKGHQYENIAVHTQCNANAAGWALQRIQPPQVLGQ